VTATLARRAHPTVYVPRVGDLAEYMPTQPVVRTFVPRFPVVSLVERALWIGAQAFGWAYLIVWGGAVGGLLLQELT
jgi:hypothetical protein